jgi:nucleoid-associated protein YgaU
MSRAGNTKSSVGDTLMTLPRVKRIALASGVVLAGIGGALVFRKPAVEPSPPPLEADIPTWVRRPAIPRAPSPDSVPRLLGQIDAVESTGDPSALPPTYPTSPFKTPAEGDGSTAAGPPPSRTVIHKIRDGDTLTSLARRYLGDGGRFQEIFAANRQRLPNADVLPIGVEIEVPIGPPPQATDDAPDESPLVPISGTSPRRRTKPGK